MLVIQDFGELPVTSPPTLAQPIGSLAPSTLSPAAERTNVPDVSPTLQPTLSPVAQPTLLPARPPFAPPTLAPVRPPTFSPVTPPTLSPVAPPTLSPVAPPTSSLVSPTTLSPVTPPILSPVTSPTFSPVTPPTLAPSTLSPTMTPTTFAPTPLTFKSIFAPGIILYLFVFVYYTAPVLCDLTVTTPGSYSIGAGQTVDPVTGGEFHYDPTPGQYVAFVTSLPPSGVYRVCVTGTYLAAGRCDLELYEGTALKRIGLYDYYYTADCFDYTYPKP